MFEFRIISMFLSAILSARHGREKPLDIGGWSRPTNWSPHRIGLKIERAKIASFTERMTKINPNEYIPKFKQLPPDDVRTAAEQFSKLDASGTGKLGSAELSALYRELKIPFTPQKISNLIKEYDADGDGSLDFTEFLTIFAREKDSGKESELGSGLRQHQELVRVAGARGERAFAQDEVAGYVQYLNNNLEGDESVKHVVPINATDDSLFKAVGDGILLCKLCKLASEDSLDERVIATGKKLNAFSLLANCTLAVNTAKSLGCSTTNIGPNDIRDGTPHLVLGLVWQLIRLALMKSITLTEHPELYRLLKPGETLADFLKLSPEQILLRWLNYHLEKAGSSRTATNFTKDLSDSEILTTVLKQIAPEACTLAPLRQTDNWQRAEGMLAESDKIGCRKFVTPKEIVNGHARLNLAFVANLFNTRPGLEELSEAEKAALDEALFRAGGTRTERQFCLWMNSCGVDPFVFDLYDGVQDGTVLLQMLDKIEPGCVDWSKASKGKLNKFKAVQNDDYALEVAKKLGLSIVGIAGANIYGSAEAEASESNRERDKKFVLAVLWQLMRYDYLKVFKKLGGGAKIKDEQIVAWANEQTAGKTSITGFKDQAIADSRPILTLINVIKPDVVDFSLVSDDPEKFKRNAMYVLSMVRTFGATVYALPEDIVEVNAQMVMTVYASLMAIGGGA
jgi:hypothetical protein